MNDYYPYNSPVVLSDSIFINYGGQTGTSSSFQRQASYLLAEEQVTDYLDTFLVPTIVTGTYFWKGHNPIQLDYGHLISVKSVGIQSVDGANGCSISNVDTCGAIRGDGKYGYLDIQLLLGCGGCGSIVANPYNIQVAYESGLPTGTVSHPKILTALTLAAQIILNEIDVSLSNEGTADIGIQSFVNQKYSELRVKKLGDSTFGNSPHAVRIARLLRKLRSKPSIGFH